MCLHYYPYPSPLLILLLTSQINPTLPLRRKQGKSVVLQKGHNSDLLKGEPVEEEFISLVIITSLLKIKIEIKMAESPYGSISNMKQKIQQIETSIETVMNEIQNVKDKIKLYNDNNNRNDDDNERLKASYRKLEQLETDEAQQRKRKANLVSWLKEMEDAELVKTGKIYVQCIIYIFLHFLITFITFFIYYYSI